jgi:hypothetical protein
MPPNDVDAAHAAFKSTANRQLRGLLAHGMEGTAASSRLLDDLLLSAGSKSAAAGSGGAIDLSTQACSGAGAAAGSAAASGGSSSGGGGSSSSTLQHVVAQTGVSPAHATKILMLKEEIALLRREGHSTVTVIEQLRERLRAAGEKRQLRAGAEEDAENADGVSGTGWRDKGSNASKKRRTGDHDPANSFSSPFASGRLENGTGSASRALPGSHTRLHELPLSPAGAAGYALGDSFEFEAKPEGKRSREENTAALAALKKLKLRTQAESS